MGTGGFVLADENIVGVDPANDVPDVVTLLRCDVDE